MQCRQAVRVHPIHSAEHSLEQRGLVGEALPDEGEVRRELENGRQALGEERGLEVLAEGVEDEGGVGHGVDGG